MSLTTKELAPLLTHKDFYLRGFIKAIIDKDIKIESFDYLLRYSYFRVSTKTKIFAITQSTSGWIFKAFLRRNETKDKFLDSRATADIREVYKTFEELIQKLDIILKE